MISNDPKIAAIHADIERNVKRMLADACRAELRCQPPTTHGVVKAALDRVQEEFSGYRLDVDDTGGPYALVGRKQDADLFAAAPDLLTALHGAQVAIHSEYCGRTCHAECLAVVAAIAKAEGRS